MRLLKYELLKVVTRRLFWGFLVAALAVNALALWWLNRPEELSFPQIKAVYDQLRRFDDYDAADWLDEHEELARAAQLKQSIDELVTENPSAEWLSDLRAQYEQAQEAYGERISIYEPADAAGYLNLFAAIREEYATGDKYDAFLLRVEENARRQLGSAVFGNSLDSFSRRNLETEAADYAAMADTEIRYDVGRGLPFLFDSPSTDILLLLLLVVVCMALITDEKDKRLFLLVKATPGGALRTIAAKLGAMAICVAGVSLVIFAGNLLFAELTYGLGDLTRTIQSVPDILLGGGKIFPGLDKSTLPLTVGQFIVLFAAGRTAGLLIIGLAVMLIAVHARHSIVLLVLTAAGTVGSAALTAIPVVSDWNWLRFLNPAMLMRPYPVLGGYLNLNLFGRPASLIPVYLVFAAVLLVGLLVAVCLSFVLKRGLETRAFKLRLPSLAIQMGGYRWYELRKLAFTGRALLILLLFVLIQWQAGPSRPYIGPDENYYRLYMELLEGPLDDAKEAIVLNRKAEIDDAREKLDRAKAQYEAGELDIEEFFDLNDELGGILAQWDYFKPVYERYVHVRATPGAEFFYDTGYRRLAGAAPGWEDAGLDSGMKLAAALALLLCGVFAVEYKTGMVKVLNATKRGHAETIRIKLLWAALFSMAAFIAAYLPDLLLAGEAYGWAGITKPLAGIIPLAGFGASEIMPVWGYLMLLFALRLLVCLGMAALVLALSLAVRNNTYAALCALFLLLVPLFLHRFGVTLLDPFGLLYILTGNGLLHQIPLWRAIVQSGVYLLLATGCVVFIIRRFGQNEPLALPQRRKEAAA